MGLCIPQIRQKSRCTWCSINTYWRTPLLKSKMDLNLSSATSLMVKWLGISLPMQGTRVWSLVREIRCHMPKPAHHNYREARVQQRGAHALQLRLTQPRINILLPKIWPSSMWNNYQWLQWCHHHCKTNGMRMDGLRKMVATSDKDIFLRTWNVLGIKMFGEFNGF